MPTAVHESIQGCFTEAVIEAEIGLPRDVRCVFVYNEEMGGFKGQYSGSNKIADLAVQIKNADSELETKLVFEIGFSEKYEDLVQDVRLWLEGKSSISMCVLVSFIEDECPINKEEFRKLKFPNPWELEPKDIDLEGPFGPATYKGLVDEVEDEEVEDEGVEDEEVEDEEVDDMELDNEEPSEELDNKRLVLVGPISAAFLERWKRDKKTGKAKKYGKRIVSYLLLTKISHTNWCI
jgi:hypothetical protein